MLHKVEWMIWALLVLTDRKVTQLLDLNVDIYYIHNWNHVAFDQSDLPLAIYCSVNLLKVTLLFHFGVVFWDCTNLAQPFLMRLFIYLVKFLCLSFNVIIRNLVSSFTIYIVVFVLLHWYEIFMDLLRFFELAHYLHIVFYLDVLGCK